MLKVIRRSLRKLAGRAANWIAALLAGAGLALSPAFAEHLEVVLAALVLAVLNALEDEIRDAATDTAGDLVGGLAFWRD